MGVRSFVLVLGLTIGGVVIVAVAGCTPNAPQAYACPTGVPWVPDDYANGKWVPGHCLGEPAK